MPRTAHVGGLRLVKIMRPSVPDGFVRRPHLDDLLDAATRRRLVLVSAGPGWGKTLAVAAWADRVAARPADGVGTSVAWLSLDEDDNAPSAFWNAVLAALRGSGAVPPDNPLSTVSLGPRLTGEVMSRLHHGLVDLTSPVVLVLDDFQVIDDHDVLDAVAALVRMELSLHLVLITRHDPVLPLHRLRVDGDLVEIRSAQLTFDVADADALLRTAGHHLDEADVGRLVEHTEGWAAGLRLAALWLAGNPAAVSVEQFDGDDRAVTEYLLVEVLEAQKPDVREFLLRTSIVPRVCGDLADALVEGDGGRHQLDQLVRANTFVTALGVSGEWFRYHPLLREMLSAVLSVEHPHLVAPLHRTAARWLSGHGEPLDALRHAAAAEDWDLVGSVFVTDCAPLVLGSDRDTVDGLLARVPDSATAGSPTLLLAAAARALTANRIGDMVEHVAQAERLMHRSDPGDKLPTTVTLYAFQAAAARLRGDMSRLLDVTARTLDLLDEHGPTLRYSELFRAVALNNRAVGLLWSVRLDEARDAFVAAWHVVERADLVVTHVNILGHLSLIALCHGRLAEAEAYADRGLMLARSHGAQTLVQSTTCYLGLGLVQLVRGRVVAAERTLQQSRLAPHTELEPPVVMATHTALTLAAVALGRPGAARRAAAVAERVAEQWTAPRLMQGWLTAALVQTRLAAGDAVGALTLLDRVAGPADGPERLWCALVHASLGHLDEAEALLDQARRTGAGSENALTVGAHVVAALVADRGGQEARALDSVRAALRSAERHRIVLPFLFDAARTAPLLRKLAAGADPDAAFAAEVADVLHDLATSSVEEPAPLVEALTDRELTVLRFLPTMRSNAEISTEMFISVNTVKAHLKALYRKLDVASRREAVRRSQSLGLLR